MTVKLLCNVHGVLLVWSRAEAATLSSFALGLRLCWKAALGCCTVPADFGVGGHVSSLNARARYFVTWWWCRTGLFL